MTRPGPSLFCAGTRSPRTATRRDKKTIEVVKLIASGDHAVAPPAVLAAWARGHRGVEAPRYVRDVTFGEDPSQVRTR